MDEEKPFTSGAALTINVVNESYFKERNQVKF